MTVPETRAPKGEVSSAIPTYSTRKQYSELHPHARRVTAYIHKFTLSDLTTGTSQRFETF